MFVCLIENNLYIIDIVGFFGFAFFFINNKTLKIWHIQLSYLEQQNIITVAKDMTTSIDLTNPYSSSACKQCFIDNFQAKTHQNQIGPGLEPHDLLQNSVTGLFIERLYRATYFSIFLYNVIKRFEVVQLKKKIRILLVFKEYRLHYEKRDKHVRQLQLDGEEEYDFHEFTKLDNEHSIILEPIVPGNL